MSLLLDALKKAAEQKARKSKSEANVPDNADDTLLNVAADVGARARPEEGGEGGTSRDETEIDHSELSARLERSSVVRGSAEETALDFAEQTEARQPYEPSQQAAEETALNVDESTETRAEVGRKATPVQEDDTGLVIPDATQTAFQRSKADDDDRDDTGLNIPEATQTRLRADSPQRSAEDETSVDLPTAAEGPVADDTNLSEQLETGEDETMFFTADDGGAEIVVESDADETDLSRVGSEDLTGIGKRSELRGGAGDDTDLSNLGGEDLTGITDPSLKESLRREREQTDQSSDSELWEKDETNLGQPGEESVSAAGEVSDDDVTVFAEPFSDSVASGEFETPVEDDETDYQHPARHADEVEAAKIPALAGHDRASGDDDETLESGRSVDDIQDEDLSLLLIEPDPTNPRDTSDLGLDDTTQKRIGRDNDDDTQAPTISNLRGEAIYGDNTRVAQGDSDTISNLGLEDATSTHTYAPDNYDRTLMKLPSDDESRLFAGMKSDSDVIMTPDYAKKVFRSKTSAQRLQHYKVYFGIAAVILLTIGIYGLMQYQEESLAIDDSLRPLKRDPMPGLIKPKVEEESSLFAATDTESTARAIEIVQTAELGAETQTAETTDTASDDSAAAAAEIEVSESTTPEPVANAESEAEGSVAEKVVQAESVEMEAPVVDESPTSSQMDDLAQAEPASSDGEIALLSSSASDQKVPAETVAEPAANLQILSSNQYRQNDVLLREAYDAYLAGEDRKALELYNKVLESDPGNRNALLARAAINVQNGNVEAAVQEYQALLLSNPKDSLAMSSLLAVAEYSPQDVETQLKLMIREEPQSPYLNFALANAYGAQNRWQEAQQHYFTALQNNPQDPNYAYNLAVSLEHISQPESAASYYRLALENINNGLATFSPDVVNQRLAVLGKP